MPEFTVASTLRISPKWNISCSVRANNYMRYSLKYINYDRSDTIRETLNNIFI